MKYFLAILFLASCGGPDCMEPGGVPTEGLCDTTIQAAAFVDEVFDKNGFAKTSNWLEVIWLDAPYSDVSVDGEDDHLYDRAWPSSMVVGLNELYGDMNHSRVEWKSVVPEANNKLYLAGM